MLVAAPVEVTDAQSPQLLGELGLLEKCSSGEDVA